MLNWFGNHKVGILGAANSGKTILLTSLLWHLSQHNQDRFYLDAGCRISDFRINKNNKHSFNFALYKNTFVQDHGWPAKTTDFSVADCRYNRSDCFCERHIQIVDIPGERVSDILLWKSDIYSEWVRELYDFWQEYPLIKNTMDEYWQLALSADSTVEELSVAYKKAMWKMLDHYCPITPSTYYLGTDGQMLGDAANSDRQLAIESRPIWDGGELLPVPMEWAKSHPREYANFCRNFKKYKQQVLKPLFDEIEGCDNFIFCVDILNILMSGPELFMQSQREFKDFIRFLAPAKWRRLLNTIGRNPPRLAFAATKADMVTSANIDRMDFLLKDLAEALMSSGIKYRRFVCSACVSTEEKVNPAGEVVMIGRDCYNPDQYVEIKSDLPEHWPDQWNGENYIYPEVVPVISAGSPPKHINLDRLFEFIIEDGKR